MNRFQKLKITYKYHICRGATLELELLLTLTYYKLRVSNPGGEVRAPLGDGGSVC